MNITGGFVKLGDGNWNATGAFTHGSPYGSQAGSGTRWGAVSMNFDASKAWTGENSVNKKHNLSFFLLFFANIN